MAGWRQAEDGKKSEDGGEHQGGKKGGFAVALEDESGNEGAENRAAVVDGGVEGAGQDARRGACTHDFDDGDAVQKEDGGAQGKEDGKGEDDVVGDEQGKRGDKEQRGGDEAAFQAEARGDARGEQGYDGGEIPRPRLIALMLAST